MAYNFAPVDREQLLLMPPSVADWLPEDHLAWFVIDVYIPGMIAYYCYYTGPKWSMDVLD